MLFKHEQSSSIALLSSSMLTFKSRAFILPPSAFRLAVRDAMRQVFPVKAIILTLAALGFALGQTGCQRKGGQTADPSALPGGAASTSASGNTQVTVPEQADARGYFDQGTEFLKNNQDNEAAESFRRATEKDKDFAEAYLKLGLAYNALNRDEDAEKAYKSAVEAYEKRVRQDSKDARAHYEMGQAFYRLHKYEDAARAFKQATKLEPENADALYELGMSQNRLARYDEAVNAFKKAVELDPDNYRAVEALEKAEDDKKRLAAMVKHQEVALKKQQEAEKKKAEEEKANGNGNANTKASPTAKPSP